LYLKRIEVIDKDGPVLNSVLGIKPRRLYLLHENSIKSKSGKIRGPLRYPILIKDNIDTADKMQTTAGALALVGNIAKRGCTLLQLRNR
jgi:amidase